MSPAQCPGTQGLSSAQSHFACSRCYLSHRNVSRSVSGRYPAFIAHIGSCDDPKPSTHLRNEPRHAVFAGCCQALLGLGPSRRYSATLSPRARTPTPAALVVLMPVSSHKTTAFPMLGTGRRLAKTLTLLQFQCEAYSRGCSHSIIF